MDHSELIARLSAALESTGIVTVENVPDVFVAARDVHARNCGCADGIPSAPPAGETIWGGTARTGPRFWVYLDAGMSPERAAYVLTHEAAHVVAAVSGTDIAGPPGELLADIAACFVLAECGLLTGEALKAASQHMTEQFALFGHTASLALPAEQIAVELSQMVDAGAEFGRTLAPVIKAMLAAIDASMAGVNHDVRRCQMTVHPHAKRENMIQALWHNLTTSLADLHMALATLTVRSDWQDTDTMALERIATDLERSYSEFEALYARLSATVQPSEPAEHYPGHGHEAEPFTAVSATDNLPTPGS